MVPECCVNTGGISGLAHIVSGEPAYTLKVIGVVSSSHP